MFLQQEQCLEYFHIDQQNMESFDPFQQDGIQYCGLKLNI